MNTNEDQNEIAAQPEFPEGMPELSPGMPKTSSGMPKTSSGMPKTSSGMKVPWIAWPSLWSIDAVLVAVTWQALFTRCFLGRGPTVSESIALGASVWLIYVADRLLDASRLNLARPHTLRHRFYHRHARVLGVSWIVVLIMAVGVVVRTLPLPLIQAGLLLAAAVLVYGAGVHFLPQARSASEPGWFTLPKEIQVGVLFALGVSLLCWSAFADAMVLQDTRVQRVENAASNTLSLAIATGLTAVLFSVNCLLVSSWENALDAAQGFSPIANDRRKSVIQWMMMIALIATPVFALSVPSTQPLCLTGLIGLVGMVVVHHIKTTRGQESRTMTRFEPRGLTVDWMLWMPAAVIIVW